MPYKDPERQRQAKKKYRLDHKEEIKKYNEVYYQRPDVIKRMKEYEQRPEIIEKRKRYEQTEKRYFSQMFNKMQARSKKHQDKAGQFEFKNGQDLKEYWYEQREKMGPNCPITRQPLTMIRKKQGVGNKIYTNLSPDRLFSSITYTKQNVLFTSAGWNFSKSRFKYHELPIYCGEVLSRRFFKILNQRFPQEEWDMIDGYDWDNNRQFYEKL